MPSNIPAALAAARLPPKSMDAVPDSIEWTIEIAREFMVKAMMTMHKIDVAAIEAAVAGK